MSQLRWLYDTTACVDCYAAAAGVLESVPEFPPLTVVRPGERVELGWRFPSAGMVNNPDGSDVLGFSWSPCECCDSRLGGDRFAVSLWAVSA